jgi:branched-chain amino acid transport system ATP-binding protein
MTVDDQALEATAVAVAFGGLKALEDVSLRLGRSEIVGLIGPNGSGKTTCLNALSGFVSIDAGRVVIDGRDATRWRPARRLRGGVARTFQGVRLFPALTIRENVEVAGLGSGMTRRAARRQADVLLADMGLSALSRLPASALGAGDERRVGIARAVASRPNYVLLDEPAAGLNDAESDALIVTIRSLAERYECGVLLVEHDMRVVMGVCARLHVLETGRTIAEGRSEAVGADPRVIEAYFGHGAAA